VITRESNGHGADIINAWIEEHRCFGDMLRRELRLGESEGPREPRHIDERLVQVIWQEQMLRADTLKTSSGKRIEVIEPGRWNTGRGPDFLGARLKLAGEEIAGDVEIHVQSEDWRRHGHHQDFEYNSVVLHVFLNARDDRPYDDKQNGDRLERLNLQAQLDPDLETIRLTVSVDEYPYGRPASLGLCHEQFLRLPEVQVRSFFGAAGRARMEDKIARLKAQRLAASPAQLIYQAIMVAQGYKSNKTLYFLLAKRVPLADLKPLLSEVPPQDREALILSILLHVAQLVPAELGEDVDNESREFVDRLRELWKPARPYFSDRFIPPTRRWYSGMRPPGFPGRRLAAVAILLGRLHHVEAPLFGEFLHMLRATDFEKITAADQRKFYANTTALLEVEGTGHYFQTHYTLGGKPTRPQALLGEPTARTILFNTLLPLAVMEAREKKDEELERKAWTAIERFPSLGSNSVTAFMKTRLFGDGGMDKGLLRTELRQQALYKIFHDCCSMNERTCDECTFLKPPFRPGTT
jgi:hypothetical protein